MLTALVFFYLSQNSRVGSHGSSYLTGLKIVQPSAQNEDILVVPEMEFCQSKRMTIFLGSIYVYKGLLMVMTLTFALYTKKSSFPL